MQKLIVELQGGLGNQLFQFANAFRIKKSLKLQHKIVLSDYLLKRQNNNSRFTPRDFSLQRLELNCRMSCLDSTLVKFENALKSRFDVGSKSFPYLKSLPLRVTEESIDQAEADLIKRSCSLLSGFWQNYTYYVDFRSEIRELIDSANNLNFSPNFQSLLSEITNSDCLVIHFRRGDYLTNSKARNFHGLLGGSYFQDAYDMNVSTQGEKKVIIFTENEAHIGNYFDYIPVSKLTVVDERLGLTNWEIFLLMRATRNLVLSNSSLSWWSAFTQHFPEEQKVYGPSRWFLQEDKMLMLPSWNKVEPDFIEGRA